MKPNKKKPPAITASFLSLFALLLAVPALNGAPMTNADVIKMVKSGLDETVIITSIQNAESGFDTSADGLIALTNAQVPKPVINAMITRVSAANAYAAHTPRRHAAAQRALRTSPNDQDTNRLIMPNGKGRPNFFLTVGPTYLYSSPADGYAHGGINMFGGTLAFGYRFNRHHKLQIDTCVATRSEDYEDRTAVHGLVAYSFCIPFSSAGHAEFRLTPTLGLAYASGSCSYFYYGGYGHYYYDTRTYTDTALAAGFGVGFTFHTSRRFLLDIGTSYLRTANTGGTDIISTTFSMGWKL